MGGPSSNSSDDSKGGGTYADQLKASQRKKKIADLLTPLPIKIIKSVAKNFSGKNKKSKSGDIYDANEAKEKIDYKKTPTINKDSGRDDIPPPLDVRTGKTQKSIEQPKVASQMNNTEVKSKLITADKTAPTTVEMANAELTDDERMLKVKRGKKTKTVLTDLTGLKGKPTLDKKILLG